MLVLAVDIDCVVVVAAVAVGGCAADASAWSCFWLLASNLTSHLKENFIKYTSIIEIVRAQRTKIKRIELIELKSCSYSTEKI